MTYEALAIEELEDKSLKEILHTVLADQKVLSVRLSDGAEVVIQPLPTLRPLPVLEGYIPEGWKDAIYDESAQRHLV